MKRHRAVSTTLSLAALAFVAACSSGSKDAADTSAVTDTTAAVPAMADTSMSPTTSTATPAASTTTSGAVTRININTASDAEILAIPGMGPRMLREFKEYRPYTSIEQFRREIGKYVDKAEVARLEQYITIK
jgi:DNA uptake protein ComE-like DNA-binding protein